MNQTEFWIFLLLPSTNCSVILQHSENENSSFYFCPVEKLNTFHLNVCFEAWWAPSARKSQVKWRMCRGKGGFCHDLEEISSNNSAKTQMNEVTERSVILRLICGRKTVVGAPPRANPANKLERRAERMGGSCIIQQGESSQSSERLQVSKPPASGTKSLSSVESPQWQLQRDSDYSVYSA